MSDNVLRYENDWAYDKYFVGDLRITTLSEVKIHGKKYKVKSRMTTVPYTDWGRQYSADSMHHFIELKELGFPIKIDLNKVVTRTTVTATKYT